jgi:hypothetical protein
MSKFKEITRGGKIQELVKKTQELLFWVVLQ